MEASARSRVACAGAMAALACSIVLSPVAASATELSLAPNPWLAVDRNRDGIVTDIVSRWTEVTRSAKTGVLSETQLRDALAKLRADQLFSASLAGNYTALLNVLVEAGALSDGKTTAKPQLKVAGSGPDWSTRRSRRAASSTRASAVAARSPREPRRASRRPIRPAPSPRRAVVRPTAPFR